MMATVFWFIVCAALLAGAGTVLTRAADAIAEGSGLGRLFVGSLFLAGATSLPELSTDISAVMIGEPDLAVGDLFGSSIANMGILALLVFLTRGELLKRASAMHLVTGGLAIGLTLVAAGLVLSGTTFTVLGVSPGSLLLLALFVAGTRATYQRGTSQGEDAKVSAIAILQFVAATVVILLLAPVFASVATRLAELSGLGTTFVGTFLLGFTTSVPELASGIAAVRMRAYDLAIGNMLGSNSFNMAVFFALDVAHPSGSLFASLSAAHAATALIGVLLMAVAMGALYRRR